MTKYHRTLSSLLLVFFFITSCAKPADTPVISTQTAEVSATETIEPTPTVEDFAISINGEKISVEEMAAEIERVSTADEQAGIQRSDEERKQYAADELIGLTLLALDAFENGFTYTDQDHQEKLDDLSTRLGSQQALEDWLSNNGYTQESFRIALERSTAAAFTRDKIMDAVPTTAKQFHVQEMLLYDKPTADYYYNQYLALGDFNALASAIDPVTRGDIGWFPLGYLPDKVIEETVSQMAVGDVVGVIEGNVGFYILKLLEIDENKLLSPDALLHAQKQAINDWLDQKHSSSEIMIR